MQNCMYMRLEGQGREMIKIDMMNFEVCFDTFKIFII